MSTDQPSQSSGEFFGSSSFELRDEVTQTSHTYIEEHDEDSLLKQQLSSNNGNDPTRSPSNSEDNVVREIVRGNLEALRLESMDLEHRASSRIVLDSNSSLGPASLQTGQTTASLLVDNDGLDKTKTRGRLEQQKIKQEEEQRFQKITPGANGKTEDVERQTSGAAWAAEQWTQYETLAQHHHHHSEELSTAATESTASGNSVARRSHAEERKMATMTGPRKNEKAGSREKSDFDRSNVSEHNNKTADLLLDIIENSDSSRLQSSSRRVSSEETRPGAIAVRGRAFGARNNLRVANTQEDHLNQMENEGDIDTIGVQVVQDEDLEQEYRNRVLEKEVIDATHVQIASDYDGSLPQSFLARNRNYIAAIACLGIVVVVVLIVIMSGGGGDDEVTAAPTLSPEEYIYELLEPISGEQALLMEGTAQNQAFTWLMEEDEMDLDIKDDWNESEILQRYIAAVIFFSFGGPNWLDDLNFLNDNSVCDWNSQSSDDSEIYGLSCNRDRQLTSLHLDSNNLQGTIPTEVASLSGLTELRLSNAKGLTGEIPGELLALVASMKHLVLVDCGFSGTVPEDVFRLTNLEDFNLQGNDLSGTLHKFPWSAKHVNVANNQFSGNLPLLQTQGDMVTMNVSGNQLTGTLPPELYTSQQIRMLDLSRNQFSGSISQQIMGMASLGELYLNNNELTGTIPRQLGRLRALLTILHMYDNLLTGSIPAELGDLYALRELDVSSNRLQGSLDESFGELESLELLDLRDNMGLTGPLPASFVDLTQLNNFCFTDTRLTGFEVLGGVECTNSTLTS